MKSGTRVMYNGKLGTVSFSILKPTGVVYNDVLLDDGTAITNRYNCELEVVVEDWVSVDEIMEYFSRKNG